MDIPNLVSVLEQTRRPGSETRKVSLTLPLHLVRDLKVLQSRIGALTGDKPPTMTHLLRAIVVVSLRSMSDTATPGAVLEAQGDGIIEESITVEEPILSSPEEDDEFIAQLLRDTRRKKSGPSWGR